MKTVVRLAIRIGYRLFDTAFYYNNEKQIGEAIREKIEEGAVKREDIFIVEKVMFTMATAEYVLGSRIINRFLLALSYGILNTIRTECYQR